MVGSDAAATADHTEIRATVIVREDRRSMKAHQPSTGRSSLIFQMVQKERSRDADGIEDSRLNLPMGLMS